MTDCQAYDDFEESVYKLIPTEEFKKERHFRYKSKFPGTLPATASTFGVAQTSIPGIVNITGDLTTKQPPCKFSHSYKKDHANFGEIPGSNKKDPQRFLKCGDKNRKVERLAEVRKNNREQLKPSVLKETKKGRGPKITEKPIINLVSGKNFVTANAVENILGVPPKKEPNPAQKNYLKKTDYGKVPKYLEKVKNDIRKEYKYIQGMHAKKNETEENSSARPLMEDERLALIEALKKKWEKVNIDYQATTHITKLDSIGKIRRKENHESELSQIEADLAKLSKKGILIDTSS